MRLDPGVEPRLLSLVSGDVSLGADAAAGRPVAPGDNLLLPYSGGVTISAVAPATLLLTDHFI